MSIEIVAIGDELLKGMAINTNAAFLSQTLSQEGWTVERHLALPDDLNILEVELREALARSSLVIATGGLGPTCDDVTRQVAAKIFFSAFHYDEHVATDLIQRFGKELPSLADQATVPSKAKVFLNPIGTAPGLLFKSASSSLILLPGVPQELSALWEQKIFPYIKEHFFHLKKECTQKVYLCLVTESEVDPHLRKLKERFPRVQIGIYPNYGIVSVFFSAQDENELIQPVQLLKEQFATHIFEADSGKIEHALHDLFLSRKKTLAFAESCTGGLMASKMTAISGASNYFLGSIVSYSSSLKQSLLQVDEETLKSEGAESSQCVSEMIAGVLKISHADYAIAVTGIAGPTGGTTEKPVGTIWAAIGEKGKKPEVFTFRAKGNRETILLSTTHRLFGALFRQMKYGVSSFSSGVSKC